ncbi:MAG: restriction endonuclease subunit S [Mogibacterium sp.]|nr:restriction endonuclease subunit S [Mogibacterium sp.]
MSWAKAKIGDHCEITSSKRIFYSEYVDSGVPFYRSKEIIESSQGQQISEPLYISIEKYNDIKSKFGVPLPGDMLLTSVGTIGIPYIVRPEDYFYFKDGNLTWFRNFDDSLISKFLCYWIGSKEGYGVLNNTTIGSSQKALTIAALKQIECPLPPVEVQRHIVDILSAYDNLIENNQKQIKLLEEAAQRLYKEWFVDLRFPGYEDTPIVDGVPEGWKKGTLGDISFFKRGKTITKAQVLDGDVPVVAGGLEPAYYHNKSNTVAPVITVSGSGANAGFTRLYNVDVFASDCSYIDSNSTPFLFFVYCFLKANAMKLDSLQKGSAQPHVYAKDLNALVLSVPTGGVLTVFCNIVSPYFERIRLLQRENEIAAQARDRLLPKLMSGEIEI